MFGHSAADIIGRNVSVLMPSPYRSEHDGYLERYHRTREPRIIGSGREVVGLRADGNTFPMTLGVSEVDLPEGKLFAGIVKDISERRALEESREHLIEQLETANAELERFTYTVSHDLKSPLITIKGFLGMLEVDAASGNMDRLRADVARIGSAADKMKQLLDELLELSRIGRVVNEPQEVALVGLCEEVVELLHGRILERGATVVIDPSLPVALVDRVRIREVFQNLVDNALKFTPEDRAPRIEIGVLPADDGSPPVLFVRDNGAGLDPQYATRIFRLFEQLDRHAEGTGIGLALVKRIVDVHGGSIRAESAGPGAGTTFFLTLPLAEPAAAPTPATR